MECLGFVLIYFMRGNLPWQGVKIVDKKQKYEMIRKKKSDMSLEELCDQINPEFVTYMQ